MDVDNQRSALMSVFPVHTRVFEPPKDVVTQELVQELLPRLEAGDVVAISSKIVALDQGRAVVTNAISKEELICSEADYYLPKETNQWGVIITVKDGCLVGSAGIDESNSRGYYLLWPEAPGLWAAEFCSILRERSGIDAIGVIITDSHSTPLRLGVVGVSVAYAGFSALCDYRGSEDLFGRKLQVSQLNLADSLAAAANLVMGEGNESTPCAIVRGYSKISFCELTNSTEAFYTTPSSDLYSAMFSHFLPGKRGGKSVKNG